MSQVQASLPDGYHIILNHTIKIHPTRFLIRLVVTSKHSKRGESSDQKPHPKLINILVESPKPHRYSLRNPNMFLPNSELLKMVALGFVPPALQFEGQDQPRGLIWVIVPAFRGVHQWIIGGSLYGERHFWPFLTSPKTTPVSNWPDFFKGSPTGQGVVHIVHQLCLIQVAGWHGGRIVEENTRKPTYFVAQKAIETYRNHKFIFWRSPNVSHPRNNLWEVSEQALDGLLQMADVRWVSKP